MKMVLFASLASLALCTGAQAQVWDGGYNPNPKHRHLKQSLKRVHRDSLRAPPPVNQTTPSVQVNSATQTIGAQTQGTNINAATNFAVRRTTSSVQVNSNFYSVQANSVTQTATATATQTQGTNYQCLHQLCRAAQCYWWWRRAWYC